MNSNLGNYYQLQFPASQKGDASNWAAMFGLMNVVFRPLGGVVADIAYNYTQSVWVKKALLHSYAFITGAFLIAIGQIGAKDVTTLVCLVGIGMAFFLEGANGLTFAVVPHVRPEANGVVSGFVGACGNLGGIMFALVFRYFPTDYNQALWIIGVVIMALQAVTFWIPPISKSQIGGR